MSYGAGGSCAAVGSRKTVATILGKPAPIHLLRRVRHFGESGGLCFMVTGTSAATRSLLSLGTYSRIAHRSRSLCCVCPLANAAALKRRPPAGTAQASPSFCREARTQNIVPRGSVWKIAQLLPSGRGSSTARLVRLQCCQDGNLAKNGYAGEKIRTKVRLTSQKESLKSSCAQDRTIGTGGL